MSLTLYWLEWAGACSVLTLLAILHRKLTERHEAEQWLETYFAQIRADRARRNRLGQFVPNSQRQFHDHHTLTHR